MILSAASGGWGASPRHRGRRSAPTGRGAGAGYPAVNVTLFTIATPPPA